jgi:hypothetical protein
MTGLLDDVRVVGLSDAEIAHLVDAGALDPI